MDATSNRQGSVTALASLLLLLAGSAASVAAPFLPKDDDAILEHLPSPTGVGQELRAQQRALGQNPYNLALATRVAKILIGRGRREADPRYYGYAQAALLPWWEEPSPPPAVGILRAILRQHRHDFQGALTDLAGVLAFEPRNAQARLIRAVILGVQGRPEAALRECLVLSRLVNTLAAATCIGNAAGLTGQAKPGYRLLREALEHSTNAGSEASLWALTVLAEIAARQGWRQVAERHFQQALAYQIRDVYLLGAYADFLLDEGRPTEVVRLLKEDTRPAGLLLRLTLAERQLGAAALAEHTAALSARMAANRHRGDTSHRREEARYYLHVLDRPKPALALARANWTVQREPADARLVLEAALAAGDGKAAVAVVHWLERTGLQDVHLIALAKRLQEEGG